jgi:hypothetical protein
MQSFLRNARAIRAVSKRGISTSAAFDFPEGTFDTHNCESPSHSTVLTREDALKFYTEMVQIRRLEMACDQVQFSHLGV